MTAHALNGDRQRCMDAGMDDYVSKPLDPRKVFQAIERWAGADSSEPRDEAPIQQEEPVRKVESLQKEAPVQKETPARREKPIHKEQPLNTAAAPVQPRAAQKLPQAVASAPGHIDEDQPLDIASAMDRFGGDQAFYINLLEDFLQSVPGRLSAMWAAMNKGDAKEIAYHAHNLKGVSANFGARQLARLAAVLDDRAREEDLLAARRMLLAVEAASERLRGIVNELTVGQPKVDQVQDHLY
jgi:two-component system, sensor histidine kinase and response regulator